MNYSELYKFPITFFGGKGGVGKTTNSAAFAVHLAQKGFKTLIVSTDPAHSLGDAFEKELNNQVSMVSQNLFACELNPSEVVDEYFASIRDSIASYTKPEMRKKVDEHLAAAQTSPGAEEAAILQALCKYIVDFKTTDFDRLVFDTAPTGHTLRLLAMPQLMSMWTDGLLQQRKAQEKLKEAALPFWKKKETSKFNLFNSAMQNRWKKAMDILEKRKNLFKQAGEILHNPKTTGIIFVMIPEMLPLNETIRAVNSLKKGGLTCSALIINQIIPKAHDGFWEKRFLRQKDILEKIENEFNYLSKIYVPLHSDDIRGVKALSLFIDD